MQKNWKAAVLLLALLSIVAGGSKPLAKLAFLFGAYETAADLSGDLAVRGAAFYNLGRYQEADKAFADVGRRATYNRAASLAATGRYELSVAYYDAVLFADRFDSHAIYNRQIVSEYIQKEPVAMQMETPGRIAAAFAEKDSSEPEIDETDPVAVHKRLYSRPRKPIEAKSISASQQWLDTLSDAPGEFLKKRLEAEHHRRRSLGLLHPEEASSW